MTDFLCSIWRSAVLATNRVFVLSSIEVVPIRVTSGRGDPACDRQCRPGKRDFHLCIDIPSPVLGQLDVNGPAMGEFNKDG
jgi:hypothetical protein